MKKKEKRMILILLVILVIAIVIFAVSKNKKGNKEENIVENNIRATALRNKFINNRQREQQNLRYHKRCLIPACQQKYQYSHRCTARRVQSDKKPSQLKKRSTQKHLT